MNKTYKFAVATAFAVAATMAGVAHASPIESSQDQRIVDEVKVAISQNADLKGDLLRIQAVGGVVYIRGSVDTDLEQLSIDEMVAKLPGVTQVVDSTSVNND